MTVSWVVIGLGVVVSFLGWFMTPNEWGYGIFGFGLAHILLGILDLILRPEQAGAKS